MTDAPLPLVQAGVLKREGRPISQAAEQREVVGVELPGRTALAIATGQLRVVARDATVAISDDRDMSRRAHARAARLVEIVVDA